MRINIWPFKKKNRVFFVSYMFKDKTGSTFYCYCNMNVGWKVAAIDVLPKIRDELLNLNDTDNIEILSISEIKES